MQKGSPMIEPKNNLAPSTPFFNEQLTAFEIWLDFGGRKDESPMYLPILLQVLLSQNRLRALLLLKKYLDLGPEAVNLSLIVGICPYITKLLQRPSTDIRNVLVSIWAHVIGFDPQVHIDLVRDKGHTHFIQFLLSKDMPMSQRCKSAFILAEICNGYYDGQQACLQQGLYRACLTVLSSPAHSMLSSALFKRMVCLCLYKLLEKFTFAKYQCLTEPGEAGYVSLYPLLTDGDYVVRACVVLALGELFGASSLVQHPAASSLISSSSSGKSMYALKSGIPHSASTGNVKLMDQRVQLLEVRQQELQLALQVLETCLDGSALVRKEAVIALSKFLDLPAHLGCIKIVAQGLQMISQRAAGKTPESKTPWYCIVRPFKVLTNFMPLSS